MKNKKTTAIRFILSAVLIADLAACGQDKPSTSDVRDGVVKNLNIAGCDLFKLTKFEKVNGYKQDDEHYQMQMSGEIVMKPLDKNVSFLTDTETYLANNKDSYEAANNELRDLGQKLDQDSHQLPDDDQTKAAVIKAIYDVSKDVRDVVGAVGANNPGIAELYYKSHPDELAAVIKDQKIVMEYREKMLTPASIKGVLYKNIAPPAQMSLLPLLTSFLQAAGLSINTRVMSRILLNTHTT
jgi:hypothetical protein